MVDFKKYRVAVGCFEPDITQNIEIRRKALSNFIETLLKGYCPDLLVFPEMTLTPDIENSDFFIAEPINGPTVTMVSEFAVKFSVNICIPIIETDGEFVYNTAVYVSRDGKVAGKYRKVVPTGIEIEKGIQPGQSPQKSVILDGLKIGTAICFDMNYPDLIWSYISEGVDMLVFPSYTYGGNLAKFWAFSCGVPAVCAFPWESVIYDRDINILAEAGTQTDTIRFGYHPNWIVTTINMQRRIYHLDFNQLRLRDILAKYGKMIDIHLMVRDARMMITVLADDLNMDKFDKDTGLIPLQRFLKENRNSRQV